MLELLNYFAPIPPPLHALLLFIFNFVKGPVVLAVLCGLGVGFGVGINRLGGMAANTVHGKRLLSSRAMQGTKRVLLSGIIFCGRVLDAIFGFLNRHWELYFLLGAAATTAYLATHVEKAQTFYFVLMFSLIPSPVILLWFFIAMLFGRWQIFWRLYGWVGYCAGFAFFLGALPVQGTTFMEVLTYRLGEKHGAIGTSAYGVMMTVVAVGLYHWTRNARLHPKVGKHDRPVATAVAHTLAQ